MHYFLRQILPPDSDPEPPIEIHLYTDSVYVGRKQFKSRFPQISRNHAVFYKSDNGNVFVKDLNSLNGVYVNDTRIGSFLKQLNSGDVIGFGVDSSRAADGLVCVLCAEDVDEVEITDNDDDDDKSSKTSKTSVNRESGLNTTEVASHNNDNVCLPDIYELPSVSEHRNRTKDTWRKVERGESSSHARNGITRHDNNTSDLSESSGIGSVSLHQNDNENVRGEPICKDEAKSPEHILLRKCFIHLVRCDDSSFQFPPDVKNPFKTEQIKLPLQNTELTQQKDYSEKIKHISHRKRRSRKLNSDSSDHSDEYIPESANTDSSDDFVKIIRVSAQSKPQRTKYSVNNKHRRKRSRKLSTDASDDSEEYIRQTTYSVNNKHQRRQSRKLNTNSSDDSKYIRQRTQSKTRRTTDLLRSKHPRKPAKKLSSDSSVDSDKIEDRFSNKQERKRVKKLSSDSSVDSDEIADLLSNKQERKRRRNSSSVSSDGCVKILYPRTSSKTRLKADSLTTDENSCVRRTNSANHVSDRKGTKPSSSKTKGNSKAEAEISLPSQDDGASYSQADTFYISDDESYLDMKSSQDCVRQEPEETGDSNSESDTFKEIFGTENSCSSLKTAVREGHSEDRNETIESILAFIQEPKNSEPDLRPAPRDHIVQTKRSGFPLSSRDTDRAESPEYHSDASIRLNDGDGSGQVRNSAGEEQISLLTENNKGIRKSSGRTLLTEPKPLTYTPKRSRGRDENFVQRKESQAGPPGAKKPKGDGTPRFDSKNSKFDDYNPPPPARKRVSHFGSKTSTSKSSDPSLANDSSLRARLSPLVNLVENNKIGIERTESSQGRLPLAKNAATDHQRPTAATAVGDHPRLPARLQGTNGVLRQLLQMNTRWLQEQVLMRVPPPDVLRGAAPLPASFDSYESYVAMFRPLIVLEIWERLYIEWRQVEVGVGRNYKFHFAVQGHAELGGCVELECESVSADGRSGPRVGDVAVLEVKEGPPLNHCTSLFGYVLGHTVKPLGPDYVLGNTPWKQLSEDWRSGGDVPKRWTFRACVKRKRVNPSYDKQSLMRGYNLGCVRKWLGWADAFSSIKDSPLLDTLLRPATYTLPKSRRQPSFDQENLHYTSEQEGFIRIVCDTVMRGSTDPEVFLLGGGPGTGKTHVVVGLIERLLYRRGAGDIRVLVAAPGDTAVDEVGRRLLGLARRYEGNSVRFVRLGHEHQVDRQMEPYCVTKVIRGASVDEAEVLRRSHVVLSTLSGLSTAHPFQPSLCIVDDASLCTEPDALQAIATGVTLLVLVGDPSQHAPSIVSRMARQYRLGRSLFERVMVSRPAHALCEQFRMHPDIARFPCPSSFPSPRRPIDDACPLRPYLVLDLPDDEDPLPVAVVCEFVCEANLHAPVATLVAPSSRRARFRAEASPLLRRHARRVEVRGPDGFHGREKDVVVLWAALACPMLLRSALTRARRCLIVCVAGQKVARLNPLWAELLADAGERGLLCTAPSTPDHLKKVLRRRLLVQPK